jgi:hypothetical protein
MKDKLAGIPDWAKIVGGIAIIGGAIWGAVAISKLLKARRIQKAYEESQKDEETKDPNVVNPQDIVTSKGKIVYAKPKSAGAAGYVNVRSSAAVDNTNSWYNPSNFIGMVVEGKPVGKVLEGNISGEGYVWYKITVNPQHLQENKELGLKVNKSNTTGYVREDNVILKSV